MPKATYLALTLLLAACQSGNNVRPEVHGHRGCRGLLPENTVPAFLKAAELGCDWLEMDVVITGDGQVLVSHEPWMEHRICRTADGESISAEHERDHNIHRMTLAEVQDFDCGSLRHPDFPDQRPSDLSKPTLAEVVRPVEQQAMMLGLGVPRYNIEIKSDPALYGTYQPEPVAFTTTVLEAITTLGIDSQCLIQSFDPAVLEVVHELAPDMPTALLVDNEQGVAANLSRLSFKPTAYSAEHHLLDARSVAALQEQDIEVLAWTVNDKKDMLRMLDLGVEGIITDVPDQLIALLDERY